MSNDDFLVFRNFKADSVPKNIEKYYDAAIEKLQTIFPEKDIIKYGYTTLGIKTDYPYSETGIDIYDLGLLDNNIPAIRRVRDDYVITFRIQ